MSSFSDLISSERLQALGFVEPVSVSSTPVARPGAVRPRTFGRPRTTVRSKTPARPLAQRTPTERAARLIKELAKEEKEREALEKVLHRLLEDLSHSADPMRALLNFARLCDVVPDRMEFFLQLKQQVSLRARLCRLLGWSQALADSLIRHPQWLHLLDAAPQPVSRPALRAAIRAALPSPASTAARLEELNRFRRRETLRIGLLDMERQTWRNADDFQLIVRQISDLAQVCVETALQIVTSEYSGAEKTTGFAVIAMGKFGARELNYSSDIDLIFLHDGDRTAAGWIGEALLKALGEASGAGALYRVDMRLRPEGKSGPLVTPLPYAFNYYESYAAAWEWQALIKSRVVAGDAALGRRFRRFTRGITWARRENDAHLREIVAMKQRSESTPEGSDPNNVKQGPGAIRDAEWVVQQLQMMVGPQHRPARASATLRAVERLEQFHALTHNEARSLREGYLFLRVLEHRLQLLDERAVRVLPDSEAELAALARRMGTRRLGASAARWLQEVHAEYRTEIRGLCERLFWGWREHQEEQIMKKTHSTHGARGPLTSHQRLQSITEGTPSQPMPAPLARQIKAALPDALTQLEYAADPEQAVANLERLCEASGNRLSLLRSLGSAPRLSRAVFSILGGSQLLSDTLIRFPQLLDMAAQRPLLAEAKNAEAARADCRSYCYTFRHRAAALRRWKAREMLRIGLRDLVLDVSPHEITREIAYLAQACLALANEEVTATLRPASERIRFAILGMGKLGGAEMHYGSDADVLFVYEAHSPFEGATQFATFWAEEVIHFMNDRTEEGTVFEVDARLRPHGRDGALAPPVQNYLKYFEATVNGIAVWERQALTRARFVTGDTETGAHLLAAIRHVAFPEHWQPGWGDELRHIKHRVETERAGKGSKRVPGQKPATGEIYDVKLGRGGLSDIEWCAQWLALRHGARITALQTPNTLAQIEAAREGGVLPAADAEALIATYGFLRRAELRLQITQARSGGAVRGESDRFKAWARACYPDEPTATSRFAEEWHRHTNAARRVMEEVRDAL